VRILIALPLVLMLLSGALAADSRYDRALFDELRSYLQQNRQTPEDYVIGRFTDHDIVFLGEMHRIKHDEELVQRLIPRLHAEGIHVLATEFGRREDQPLIDRLLSAPEFDSTLANRILFQQFVHWGYREYRDIYRAAWRLNRSLAPDEKPFRILGVNCSPDWSIIKTEADRDVDSLKRLVWGGCSEKDWAEVVLEAVRSGDRVLAHCGIHHGFTDYYQPIVNNGEFIRHDTTRFGNYVKQELGDRAMTIYLHALWTDRTGYGGEYIRPVGGIVDALMDSLGEEYYPVGFDIDGTPFERFVDSSAVYSQGYENFTPAVFCDGYIFQTPFREAEVVTLIDGFFNEDNLAEARRGSPNPRYRDASIEDFEKGALRTLVWYYSLLRKY